MGLCARVIVVAKRVKVRMVERLRMVERCRIWWRHRVPKVPPDFEIQTRWLRRFVGDIESGCTE
jgi:hypothetical protein